MGEYALDAYKHALAKAGIGSGMGFTESELTRNQIAVYFCVGDGVDFPDTSVLAHELGLAAAQVKRATRTNFDMTECATRKLERYDWCTHQPSKSCPNAIVKL